MLLNKINKMKEIILEKLTLNCGTGTEASKLERALKMLQLLSNAKPVKTVATRRIPTFDISPGKNIGCMVTIRGANATELIKKLLAAINNKLSAKQINPGSFSFGIKEYIEIPGISFQRDIGILGLQACITLKRAGFGIKKRKIKKGRIPVRHRISKEETIQWIQKNFNTEIK